MVFVERYASDLLKWDILTFFGHNPDFSGTTSEIAQYIGRTSQSIRPELGDLALLGVLLQEQADGSETVYRLTPASTLRRLTLKFAESQ